MCEEGKISRSCILYRSSNEEMWYDLEEFYRDHLQEINQKLTQLDDEIWGKIILMEKNRRIAKAYLRTTTLTVDGGCFGFDGRTIGFNSFDNPYRDQQTEEMKQKIAEGVILKMDFQGNIIAMARGPSCSLLTNRKAAVDSVDHPYGTTTNSHVVSAPWGTPNSWAAVQLQHALQSSSCHQNLEQLAQLTNTMSLSRPPRRSQSKSKLRPLSNQCGWGAAKSMDSLYEPIDIEDDDVAAVGSSAARVAAWAQCSKAASEQNFSLRSRPAFERQLRPQPVAGPKKSFLSNVTYGSLDTRAWSNDGSNSDYESAKDIYGSFSSSSRSTSANGRSSPSIVSEAASESQTSDSGYIESTTSQETTSTPKKHCRTLDNVAGLPAKQCKTKHHNSLTDIEETQHQIFNSSEKLCPKSQRNLPPLPPPTSAPSRNHGGAQRFPEYTGGGIQRHFGAFKTCNNTKVPSKIKRILKPSMHLQQKTAVVNGSSVLESSECDTSSPDSSSEVDFKSDSPGFRPIAPRRIKKGNKDNNNFVTTVHVYSNPSDEESSVEVYNF